MTYKELKTKLKNELKEMAKTIRFKKGKRKFEPNGYVYGLFRLREDFRIKHLAYCMLGGTPYEKIESKHSKHQDVRDYRSLSNEEMEKLGFKTKSVMEVYEAEYIKEEADKLLENYQSEIKEDVA